MLIDLFADIGLLRKHDDALVTEVKRVTEELTNTMSRFNEATDSDEIESLIYRMKELEMHYSFLLRQAKLERICDNQLKGEIWR